jgi:SAM-dependent methyltransferase
VSSDHERHNRAFWDRDADDYQDLHGGTLDAAPRAWGAWRIPDDEVTALGDARGLDVLELGCGAAQWAIALAGAGARPVGLDLSGGQQRQSRTLQSDYFDMRSFVYGDGTADFQLPYGEWIRLFRRNRFVIDDLVELRPSKGATTTYTDLVPYRWARRWPAEQIWKLHKEP